MNEYEAMYRHELKYVISEAQLLVLKSRISCVMQRDPHAGKDGMYNIRSLYFDDYVNRCYYENENGIDPREKFRIRIYNHSTERIALECKRKERGKTLKTSCLLTLEQAQRLIQGKTLADKENLHPLLRKLLMEKQMHLLQQVVIV